MMISKKGTNVNIHLIVLWLSEEYTSNINKKEKLMAQISLKKYLWRTFLLSVVFYGNLENSKATEITIYCPKSGTITTTGNKNCGYTYVGNIKSNLSNINKIIQSPPLQTNGNIPTQFKEVTFNSWGQSYSSIEMNCHYENPNIVLSGRIQLPALSTCNTVCPSGSDVKTCYVNCTLVK